MAKIGIIIVAGGSGRRMGGDVPKQFLELCGKPVLMHTIGRFCGIADKIVVVLPDPDKERWGQLVKQYAFSPRHTVVTGGQTRFHSVRNALTEVQDCDYVGVHDGVRPLVTKEVICRVLASSQRHGAAIPVVEVTDSLREIDNDRSTSLIVDRSRFRSVQTPQFFTAEILFGAYDAEYKDRFTDDASVVEAAGHNITLVPGDTSNIKITTPVDMATAEALLGLYAK